MKMTLEINMTNGQDIVDAMNALKALADRNAVLIEEAEYHEESENMKSLESPSLDEVDVKVEIEDTQVNEELKSELESYKKIVDELKKEKASLINEKELLNDKIAS